MKNLYYILKDKVTIETDLLTWAKWFEHADRQLAIDVINDVTISTVFIGTNMQYGDGPPLLFETMIFGGINDEFTQRYSTYEEAMAGHANALAMIKIKINLV